MQIVINISDSIYKDLQLGIGVGVVLKLEDIVVLPKGHGRLIDEKDLSLMTVHMIDGMFVCDAPTIIEADGGDADARNSD